MEFRILGPLDVERGDRPLRLGARRERTVLALLLLQANTTVSVDSLVDQLWPVSPPPSALHAVHVAVSRLRRLLDEDQPRIRTQRPGYALRVEPGELDADTFEALLAAATDTWRAGEADATSRLLHEALGLWRGTPLADLADEPFVTPVAARLDEARLEALELCAEADLALGREARLVGQLEDLAAAHPLREGLRALLMQALVATGRRSDALQVYRESRALLIEELGVEPGARLRQLHREILAEDDSGPGRDPDRSAVVGPDERKVISVVCLECSPAPAALDDPERFRRVSQGFADVVRDAVSRTGGVVEESTGTAVLATFGARTALQDHAQRALTATLDACRRCPPSDTKSAPRAGVSSGEVVVGHRGGRATVNGHAVVEAARLQQAAAPGQVLVSARTWRLARAQFRFSLAAGLEPALGPVRQVDAAAEPPDDVLGPHRPFVGRHDDLERLRAEWQRTRARGRPRVVTVVGEAGLGKTSLVRELVAALQRDDDPPHVRSGRCLAYGGGITFWPMAEILRAHLGVGLSTDADTVRQRLGDLRDLGLTLGLDNDPGVHPLTAQQALRTAWLQLLDEMARHRPGVVWVVEDVHWAEPALLDLLDHVVQHGRVPLLVLCTGRPELADLRPEGVGGPLGTTLQLGPLDAAESEAIAAHLLGDVPDELQPVLQRAEGNPFFLEELVASLIDTGTLVARAGGWEVRGPLDTSAVPDTVRGALASRIDRTSAVDRVSLQAAAVAGREFSTSAVAELAPGSQPDYARLVERGFLVTAAGGHGDERYAFKHALTREVVYDGIGREDRADLHGQYADWLATRGNSDEYAALLAHHYQHAVQPVDLVADDPERQARNDVVLERAITWLHQAGEQAIARHAIDEGLDLLGRALALEVDPERQAHLLHAIGRGHAIRYDGMACWRALERAVDLTGDPSERAAIRAELALQTVIRYAMLNPMPTRELVDDWITQALDEAPPGSLARAQALAARAMWFAPDPAAAAEAAHEAASRLDDAPVLDHAYNALALAAFTEGRYEDAKGWAARRLEMLDVISDPDVVVDIYSAMIPGLLGLGDFDEAMRYARLHDEAASRLSSHHRVHAVAMRLEVHELTAGWQQMAELGERTRAAVEANRTTPCARNARSLLCVAVGLQCLADVRAAREFEAVADDAAMAGYEGSTAPLRMMLALSRDDLAEVERLLPLAVPPPPAKNWWRLVTTATRLDALAQLGEGERAHSEAVPLLVPGTYLGAFAMRALALLDHDASGLRRAAAEFAAIGLNWHEAQTLDAVATGRLRW